MTRLIALGVLLGCGGVLGVAAWLRPDPRGLGTHQQFGFAPCGFLLQTRLPCPSCGMTTAFAHAVRFHWLRAVYAQPGGFILALGAAIASVAALLALLRGRWPAWHFGILTPYRLFLSLLIVLVGGWALKILFGLIDGTLPVRN
ncbi:hypothetical protein RAS1_18110 [Phycisphaerae bacterium RAS1]|nr:hypothetical protein RAS1_18110 [Phycisphaerae bacterium RAS1]